ncbi:MAG TPA: hypothetical protein PLH79_06985 [bacterium]|nr:hypothetical protein [bacterium]HPP01417.1 hypothetical protein [bacterium]
MTPTSRRRWFVLCLWIFFWIPLPGLPLPAWSDLVIFHNGDFRYGDVTELPNQEIALMEDGTTRQYKRSQIREIIKGINRPSPGEIVTATGFVHAATAELLAVTGAITHRVLLQAAPGKKLVVDVENGFAVPRLRIWRSGYPFFQRQGCFIAGELVNATTHTWFNTTFRATLYDGKDTILSSKDFYVFRLGPGLPNQPSMRKFEIDFPDVPYPRVKRMRLVRRF